MPQRTTTTSAARRGIFIAIAITVPLLLTLTAAELIMRALDYKPWMPWALTETYGVNENIGTLLALPEERRAWTNRPGKYVYPGYSPGTEDITVNIRDDHGRYTSADNPPFNPKQSSIVFIGGSQTMGYAISDNETFAWKTKARYPDRNVFNYGIPGQGTYQSLLTLEEVIPKIPGRKLIVYGFMPHHAYRNVLDATWMHMFAAPGKGTLPPYVSLNQQGELVRHPTGNHTPWPLKDKLAIVAFAEKAYIDLVTRGRNKDQNLIFMKLVNKLSELSEANDGELVVLFLKVQEESRNFFSDELKANNIPYAECADIAALPFDKDYTVIGEGHPNGRMNTLWAECISDYIEKNSL